MNPKDESTLAMDLVGDDSSSPTIEKSSYIVQEAKANILAQNTATKIVQEEIKETVDLDIRLKDDYIPYMEMRIKALKRAHLLMLIEHEKMKEIQVSNDEIKMSSDLMWHMKTMIAKTEVHLNDLKKVK